MVKGIDFDMATLLVMQLMGTQKRNKGNIYGGLYLTHFIQNYYDRVLGINIIKPIEPCPLRALRGSYMKKEKPQGNSEITLVVQPPKHHQSIPEDEVYRLVLPTTLQLTWEEIEFQMNDIPSLTEQYPLASMPPPKIINTREKSKS